MKNSFYAVKKGKIIGVFDNWIECQKSTQGYKGAEFKSFSTREEAEAYINEEDYYQEQVGKDLDEGFVVAYTDGSYDKDINKYGYGVHIIYDNFVEEDLCGASDNPSFIDSKNVAGEVIAVLKAFDWCVGTGKNKLKIYHDYEGISKWINGDYNANSKVSKMLVDLYENKYQSLLECTFVHVDGHSNNKYNNIADGLAKSALFESVRKRMKSGIGWFSINSIDKDDLESLLKIIADDNKEIFMKDVNDGNTLMSKEIQLDDNHLILKLYKRKNKLLIQGNETTSLFQLITSYITELLSENQITTIMSDAYDIRIDNSAIKTNFDIIFNNIPSDIPQSMNKLIKQSLANLQLNIENAYDYSFLLVPVYRALDGLLKYKLEKIGVHIAKGSFNCFNLDNLTGKYYLPINCDSVTKDKIEKCYNFYMTHRNANMHFGEIISATGIDDTMIIENIDEAKELINETLNIISESI